MIRKIPNVTNHAIWNTFMDCLVQLWITSFEHHQTTIWIKLSNVLQKIYKKRKNENSCYRQLDRDTTNHNLNQAIKKYYKKKGKNDLELTSWILVEVGDSSLLLLTNTLKKTKMQEVVEVQGGKEGGRGGVARCTRKPKKKEAQVKLKG